jgi:hypothetical protein
MASTPKPPDPYKTAAAQQNAEVGAGQASSIINNANQYTPWGNQTYSQAGWETVYGADGKAIKVPRYNQVTTLSPDQQALLGLNTQMQYNLGQTGVEQSSKLNKLLGTSMTTAGMQDWTAAQAPGAVSTDFRQDQGPTDRAAIENAMMASYHRANDPQFAAQEASLAARGLSPGSQGYGTFQQGRDDSMGEAARQAYLGSGQESRAAQDAYNQVPQLRNAAELQRYQMGSDWASQMNNLRQGQLQEQIALRNQPINEITALLGSSQVTSPQFQPFSRQGINAANTGGYIQQNYGQQAANAAAFNQGLFGLGSAGLYGGLSR